MWPGEFVSNMGAEEFLALAGQGDVPSDIEYNSSGGSLSSSAGGETSSNLSSDEPELNGADTGLQLGDVGAVASRQGGRGDDRDVASCDNVGTDDHVAAPTTVDAALYDSIYNDPEAKKQFAEQAKRVVDLIAKKKVCVNEKVIICSDPFHFKLSSQRCGGAFRDAPLLRQIATIIVARLIVRGGKRGADDEEQPSRKRRKTGRTEAQNGFKLRHVGFNINNGLRKKRFFFAISLPEERKTFKSQGNTARG